MFVKRTWLFLLTKGVSKANLIIANANDLHLKGGAEMSHLHIPDGVLSPFIWVPGYILTFGIIYFILRKSEGDSLRQKIPFTGIAAALMLLAMSIPLGIIPVHLSLASLTGILLGPGLGFLAVFSVNLILALIGHGGITLIGINTLVIGTEVLLSSFLFRKILTKMGIMSRTFISVSISLVVSVTIMILIFMAAFGTAGELPFHIHNDHHGEDIHESVQGIGILFLIVFSGIFIESTATSFIVSYFSKVRPDMISK